MKPTCSCGARLRWVKSVNGKWMPIDPDPVEGGVLLLERNLLEETIARVVGPRDGTHMPHFATCPDADRWRRPGPPSRSRRRRRHREPS